MSIFVTLDGPNGVGKTTLIKEIMLLLEEKYSVFITKEPTSSSLGEYVLDNEATLNGKVYAHLIAADRCYHIEEEITPSIKKYEIILCDRYVASSMVLQRFDGVSIDYIWKLNSDFLIPDLSIILMANPTELESRLSDRLHRSRFEREMSREIENDYYIEAGDFLKEKGYNVLIMDNSEKNFNSNTIKIFNKINDIVEYNRCLLKSYH